MSKISDLELRFLHRELVTSDATPTQYTASGGTLRTAMAAALTEAADYWVGAIARWDVGDNAGLFSNVADFDAATDTLTFDDDLPNAVDPGDKFTLFLGGKHASSQRVPGLRTSPLVNVTGFDLTYAAMLNDEGTGTLRFDQSSGTLSWQPPGEIEGAAVDVSGLGLAGKVTLYGPVSSLEQRSKYVLLTRTAAALPGLDAQDDVSLDLVSGSFIARVTGDETTLGVVIYRPAAVRNTASSAVFRVRAWCPSPFPDAAATTLSVAIGTADATLAAGDLSSWGAHGWVFNATKNDVRYYFDRSGNSASILDPDGGARGFSAVDWDAGDALVAFPWFDMGVDAPGVANVFEDPATRATAPAGVAFSCPLSAEAGLVIGDLAAGAVSAVWVRIEIPAGFRPIEGARVDLRVRADVTE